MRVFALADLHLSVGVPEKKMDVFGPKWTHYMDKMEEKWRSVVGPDDLILLPGDISWAMKLEEAAPDFEWIEKLPGTKVMIRGNHDYWWSSISKVRAALPPSLHAIHNDTFTFNGITVAGTRFWDSPEFNFGGQQEVDEKIFNREIGRLEMSLKKLDPNAKRRLAMTHYPPIGADLKSSKASALLEKYNVSHCLFGHLHALDEKVPMFGEKNGVHYILTAADYIDFTPRIIFEH
ncbi:MAG: metallophosphoesterase [Chlamydiales bacterium]|nr:metallophosphoesterase [Chlamydiales bacterium]